jgi:hypothetical protein
MEKENKEKHNKTPLIIIGIAIIIFILMFSGNGNSNFTVYPVTCIDWFTTPPTVVDFSNCNQPKAMNRQTFSVNTTNNQVIQTSPDTADVHQLEYCTIQDEQHWSCGDWLKMPGGVFASSQISRSGENFVEKGLTGIIFVTKMQWDSINNGKSSECGLKWCDQ